MLPVKAIQFRYRASSELDSLFEGFRLMCNDAIRIAFMEKPKSRFKLIESAYFRLKQYGLHTHYLLSACEIAYSVYKNKNRKSSPYVKQAFLKLDNQSYTLNHMLLRIPVRPREFIYLTLQGSDYHFQYIDDPTLKRGSITLGRNSLSIAFSKEVADEIKPLGNVGIDVNERNITTSDTLGVTTAFDTSSVMEVKERYRAIRAKIGRQTRQDVRISQRLYAKYGRREKNRTVQRLHIVSKKIVQQAKEKKLRIIMENLKGIRKLYRKGNGQGALYRGRMNSWTFREVQRQIEYKAAWEGIPVTYVNPRGTSRNCPECGSRVVMLAERKLYCPRCDKTWDRDELASLNIMSKKKMKKMTCVVPQARSSIDEAVKGNEQTVRRTAPILQAEGWKLTLVPKSYQNLKAGSVYLPHRNSHHNPIDMG
ncbi:MAG: transposase [Thaumarchaeota archaeon]|nr:transposase [Nitrososphaerota archaeon]MCL5317260.1 transposase [Nitrososphaerota archaeon]